MDSSLPVEELLDDGAFLGYASRHGQGNLYAGAAGLVRHLIDTLGKDRFLEFFGRWTAQPHGTCSLGR